MKLFIYLFAVVSLSLFSIIPFFNEGFFSMHDDTQVARVHQMTQSISDGMFPVRWVKDLGFGYGYPIFNYYAPLPYYIGALFALFSSTALIATKITFIFAIIFSGVSMFFFLQSFFSRISALVAALVYLYFPYHAVNIYIRGNLNEVYAYAFLPLVLLGFFKLFYLEKKSSNKDYIKWITLTGISASLVIISHNLTALMLGFILFILTIFLLLVSKNKLRFLVSVSIVGSLALGFSAFYWVPAIFEMRYANVMSQVGGTADFRDHFICLSQLWNSEWGFGGSGPGCIDGMSFKLGKINVLFTVVSFLLLSLVLILRKKLIYPILQISIILMLLFSVFMTLPYSKFLWNVVPGLEFLQFPWRFLNFIALGMSFVIGLITYYISTLTNKKITVVAGGAVVLATIIFNYKLFVPQEYYPERDNSFYSDRNYINFQASSLTSEYMPKGFIKPEKQSEVPNEVLQIEKGDGKISLAEFRTGYLTSNLDLTSPSTVLINIAYFPAWNITVNGTLIEPKVIGTGMQLDLDKGNHKLEAKFVQTTLQKTSNVISIISIILVTIIFMKVMRTHKTKN